MSHRPIASPEGLEAVKRVRGLLADLPEVEEKIDRFGHTSFRIRDKPFVIMGEDGDGCWLSLKADRHLQRYLLTRPEFKKTPYIGQHGWVSIRVNLVPDWMEAREIAAQAYAALAPARLRKMLELE